MILLRLYGRVALASTGGYHKKVNMGVHMTKYASHMKGDRSRDDNGELRRKRDDTLIRSLEKEFDIKYTGMRPEQTLADLRKKTGLGDIKDINRKFGRR